MDIVIRIALVVIALPFCALVVHTFLGSRMPRKGDWFATGCVFVSLGLSGYLFLKMFSSGTHFHLNWSIPWLILGNAKVSAGVLVDNLTIVMLVIVTLVSAVVHLFSIGYMHDDRKYCRYFTYLLLFTTSMLGLVLTNNLLTLYIFWELVGLSSYLLIGHWFERPSAAHAALKAFITTRLGDIGMFLAILIIYLKIGSLNYEDVFHAVATGALAGKIQVIVGLGVFLGAMGKSAQFPFHVWLPDAMEGPTPISALIHAATMVAAGVYLVGRLFLLFNPVTLLIIAYVGCFTALFAATIALVMDDIKKVLAYSTVSQLGYMMLGLGVGGYVAGLFHLTTHAAFKALLFLASGSVIHALHTQSMREMGGLRKKMPITAVTCLIGVLAISGVPLFAGFYSKDAIIASALAFGLEHSRHIILFVASALTAGITAFYMFRLYFKTFTGAPRDHEKFHHAHESPWVMTVPLIILAFFSIVAGYSGWFERLNPKPTLAAYASPRETINLDAASESEHSSVAHHAHNLAMASSVGFAGVGILLSYLMFYRRKLRSAWLINTFKPIYTLLWNKYYIDEFYHAVLIKPLLALVRFFGAFDLYVIDGLVNFSALATRIWAFFIGDFDNQVIDGAVNGTAHATGFMGNALSFVQTGKIRNYVLFLCLSAVILISVFVFIK
jgi:NADH-quinone oxidoreductase subunit L